MNAEAGVQLDLVGALKRQAPVVLAVAVGVFLVAYWIAMTLPSEYTSYATMLVEPPSIDERLVDAGVAQQDLNTRLNLMTAQILSRPRLSRLIDELGLYGEESKRMTRDQVINIMRGKVSVVPVEGALIQGSGRSGEAVVNTFQIYFTDSHQATPSEVAQALAQDFIDEHIAARIETTQRSLEFIGVEEQRLENEIAGLQQSIGRLKTQNLGSLPEDRAGNERLLMNTMLELRTAQSDLATALSEEQFWAERLSAVRSGAGGGADSSPERRKQTLELALAEYRARGFTEKHPDVIDVLLEIEQVEAKIAEARSGLAAGTANIPFEHLTTMGEQERASRRATAARDKIARLQNDLEVLQARADAIPRVAEQLDALERQWKQTSRNLSDFENRKLSAAVQANLERRQLGEQFRILEPAFRPLDPSAPNRLLILGIGVFMGVFLGLGAGILLEAIDPTLHKVAEVQDAFSVPVLAAIPTIEFEADLARKRKRTFRLGFASFAFVGLNLVGGAAAYYYVNVIQVRTPGAVVEEEVTPEAKRSSESRPSGEPASESEAPSEASDEADDSTYRVPIGSLSPERFG